MIGARAGDVVGVRAMARAAVVTCAVVMALATAAFAQAPSPAFTAEFQAGIDAYRLGQYAEARAHLERARALEPALPGPHRFLAAVGAAEGKWPDCIRDARAAIAANPASTEIAATRKLHDDCRASLGLPGYGGDYADGGAIAVAANVAGAAVTIGGLRAGATPLAPRPIGLGDVEVTATKAGWNTATAIATVLPGVVTDVELVLLEEAAALAIDAPPVVPELGWLVVRAPGAAIAIDGQVVTADDRGRYPLPPGEHTVTATRPGAVTAARTVRVSRGQEHHVAIELVSLAGVERRRTRGRIALGVAGGLAAAGVVTGLLAMRAADEARDWAAIERARPTGVPIGDTAGLAPIHTRAAIEARGDRAATLGLASGVLYGAAAAALGIGVYFLARGPDGARVQLGPVVDRGWGVAVEGALP